MGGGRKRGEEEQEEERESAFLIRNILFMNENDDEIDSWRLLRELWFERMGFLMNERMKKMKGCEDETSRPSGLSSHT